MKAAVIEQFGKSSPIKICEIETPMPRDNEVQIAVKYAAVNPIDWKIREGYLRGRMPEEFPLILGWDAAGVVSQVGKEVTQYKVGDEVYAYCRKPLIKWGTFAEYVCVDASGVAKKPKTLSFAMSAALPLTALTAWQSLFTVGELKKNEVVLIHAGAGGVGGMALQFAKLKGAYVITTASSKNTAYVKARGADCIIDYTQENFVEKIREKFSHGIDFVYDTMGGEICTLSVDALKTGGRLVSILVPNLSTSRSIHAYYVFVEPSGEQLTQIADLVDQGKVIAPEIHEMPFDKVDEALHLSESRHVRGKIVIKIA